jgi:hypothetical protein
MLYQTRPVKKLLLLATLAKTRPVKKALAFSGQEYCVLLKIKYDRNYGLRFPSTPQAFRREPFSSMGPTIISVYRLA